MGDNNQMKTCPYCGNSIRYVAKKCRFCGEWLDEEQRNIHQKPIPKYCCPIKPLYTAISSLNPAEIGMISSYFKFQAPH